jgi:F-type H+-transporting ATPase subunit epsilon
MAEAFNFELVSPERLLFSEQVVQVIVPGVEGEFTVLAKHAPVMTTLRAGVVDATLASGGSKRIFVRGGFADVTPDGFTLLAEEAMPIEDLNADALATQIKDAEEDVADASSAGKKEAAQAKLNQLKELKGALGH